MRPAEAPAFFNSASLVPKAPDRFVKSGVQRRRRNMVLVGGTPRILGVLTHSCPSPYTNWYRDRGWRGTLLPAIPVDGSKLRLPRLHIVMIGHDDDWDVPAAILRPERLNHGEVAKAGGAEVNKDDVGRRLPDSNESFLLILSHQDDVTLFFEAFLIRSTRHSLIVDEERGNSTSGDHGEPPIPFSNPTQEEGRVH
jgi:hypothetical protein